VVVVRGDHGSTPQLGLRISGAVLLAVSAGIHLDLYLTGYRKIPTIGWLFLLQVLVGFMLTIAALVTRSRLASAASAALALSTLGAYLLAVWIGLFGFKEIRTRAGLAAGLIEVAAFATLALAAVTANSGRHAGAPARAAAGPSAGAPAGSSASVFGGTAAGSPASVFARTTAGSPASALAGTAARSGRRAQARAQRALSVLVAAVSAVSVAALALLGVAVVSAGGSPVAAADVGATLKTVKVGGVDVLANADGFTLYWFAPDTSASSKCFGSCAVYWPPVSGSPAAGPGVTGKLGTIKRPGGGLQATYDGHPLYTYIGDRGPGQANGNDLDLNGGYWYDIHVSR
jgi:predicted lipoprotein with Yx(FWY)xxD motif